MSFRICLWALSWSVTSVCLAILLTVLQSPPRQVRKRGHSCGQAQAEKQVPVDIHLTAPHQVNLGLKILHQACSHSTSSWFPLFNSIPRGKRGREKSPHTLSSKYFFIRQQIEDSVLSPKILPHQPATCTGVWHSRTL